MLYQKHNFIFVKILESLEFFYLALQEYQQ